MEKYESRQQQVNRPAEQIYAVLSDFRNFTPIIKDRVDNWHAEENRCSFKVKGINMSLSITDKVPGEYIKFSGEEGGPMDFTLWIQMKELDSLDTRIRLVLHADLNMMMKMMIGNKIQGALDQMAEQIAMAFNGTMPMPGGMNPGDVITDYGNFMNPDKPVS